MSENPEYRLELDIKRDLLNQEALSVLSQEEKLWLSYLYDTDPWVSQNLTLLLQADEKNKISIIKDMIKENLGATIENKVNEYITAEYDSNPEMEKKARAFVRTERGQELVSRVYLSSKLGLVDRLEEDKAALLAGIYEFEEIQKESAPIIAVLNFKNAVEALELGTNFRDSLEEVISLRKLARDAGEDESKKILQELIKVHGKDSQYQNFIKRLERAIFTK